MTSRGGDWVVIKRADDVVPGLYDVVRVPEGAGRAEEILTDLTTGQVVSVLRQWGIEPGHLIASPL